MKRIIFVFSLAVVGGCGIELPSGIFACETEADCPSGLSCIGGFCTALKCEEESWEQLANLVGQGAELQCGELLNSCGELVQGPVCPDGASCGEQFLCEDACEEVSCATYDGGAQCGSIPSACEPGTLIDCGRCAGSLEVCEDNQCVCPDGVDCDSACPGGCEAGESCVDGVCCVQEFPCQINGCSPEGALWSNGCGGFVHCGGCDDTRGDSCEQLAPGAPWACVNCCEAEGLECGVCGETFCGQCSLGEQCQSGRCVARCEDRHEPNDSELAPAYPCGAECLEKVWSIEVSGALDAAGDQDYFGVLTPHTTATFIGLTLAGSIEGLEMSLHYLCPDGSDAVAKCSGNVPGLVCREDSTEAMWISKGECKAEGLGQVLALLRRKPGVTPAQLCQPYTLEIQSLVTP